MYQLWGGGGAPFTYADGENECIDRAGTRVRLLGAVPEVVEEVGAWGGRIAIASRTDEPEWAREILGKFKSAHGNTIIDLIDPDLIEM